MNDEMEQAFQAALEEAEARATRQLAEQCSTQHTDGLQAFINDYQGGKAMTGTMWICDQLRAGRLYNRMMFDTRAEAMQFAQKMQQMEPDQVFSVEPVEAASVWN